MKCINCSSKIDELYRVNERGDVFCGDDCYEEFMCDNDDAPDDDAAPYIDDYACIRMEYIDFIKSGKSDLNETRSDKLSLKIDDMLDLIDSFFDEYFDYYRTEGDDGVFAREIYLYLLKFEKLQKQLIEWRPKPEFYYYFSFQFSGDKEEFSKRFKEKGLDHLYSRLKKHLYSWYPPSIEYKKKGARDLALSQLKEYFPDEITDIRSGLAYVCNCCHFKRIYLPENHIKNQDSWFYCEVCEEKFHPGIFSKNELLEEFTLYDKWRNLKKHSKTQDWPYYLRKIKRSCRMHNVDYPDWIELNYDF